LSHHKSHNITKYAELIKMIKSSAPSTIYFIKFNTQYQGGNNSLDRSKFFSIVSGFVTVFVEFGKAVKKQLWCNGLKGLTFYASNPGVNPWKCLVRFGCCFTVLVIQLGLCDNWVHKLWLGTIHWYSLGPKLNDTNIYETRTEEMNQNSEKTDKNVVRSSKLYSPCSIHYDYYF